MVKWGVGRSPLWGVALVVAALPAIGCSPNTLPPPPNPVVEFPVAARPGALAVGPDGNVWYTESIGSRLGYLTPSGFSTDFWTGIEAGGITAGPDGNVWFTGQSVYSITTAGAVHGTGLVLGTLGAAGIVTGPDGAIWFTEEGDYKIGRVTTDGSLVEYPLGDNLEPWAIIVGPDGNLWFTVVGYTAQYIGRITPAGEITEFMLAPTPTLVGQGLAIGADGNIWFTASDQFNHTAAKIGRIDIQGNITLYDLPNRECAPAGITAGADGNLWFVESATDRIGRVTTAGEITEFQLPTRGADVTSLVTTSDGTLWFGESSFTTIGSLKP